MAQEKRYCANCLNCIVIRQIEADKYILRSRCTKRKWVKRSGEEKLYKYFTVARRVVEDCDMYEEAGELFPYLKNLRQDLPIKDDIYSLKD
jgi:hypothetical protein